MGEGLFETLSKQPAGLKLAVLPASAASKYRDTLKSPAPPPRTSMAEIILSRRSAASTGPSSSSSRRPSPIALRIFNLRSSYSASSAGLMAAMSTLAPDSLPPPPHSSASAPLPGGGEGAASIQACACFDSAERDCIAWGASQQGGVSACQLLGGGLQRELQSRCCWLQKLLCCKRPAGDPRVSACTHLVCDDERAHVRDALLAQPRAQRLDRQHDVAAVDGGGGW